MQVLVQMKEGVMGPPDMSPWTVTEGNKNKVNKMPKRSKKVEGVDGKKQEQEV